MFGRIQSSVVPPLTVLNNLSNFRNYLCVCVVLVLIKVNDINLNFTRRSRWTEAHSEETNVSAYLRDLF